MGASSLTTCASAHAGDPVLGDENGDREQAKTQNLKITRANGTYAHLDDYLGVGQRRHDGGVARNAR